jgi:uncharacterized protein (DUF2252 family)
VNEIVAAGKAARKKVSRASHGDWQPASDRPDPIAILKEQANDRVQELLPIRYGRMVASPFAFYRGAAAVMAADLATGPNTGIKAQLAGDAHLSNFGGFAAPDRTMVFDINDFDETLPGPWEWDVKRLVASFAVAGRSRGLTKKVRASLTTAAATSYRESMRVFASEPNLTVWYERMDLDRLLASARGNVDKAQIKRTEARVDKAKSKDSVRAYGKLTAVVDGHRQIVSDPPLIVRLAELFDEDRAGEIREILLGILRKYRRSLPNDRRHLLEEYELVDVARKVVGVGSVGTRCWIALMRGLNEGDPLFLQIKEASPSVLAPYSGKSKFAHEGERVVAGQRLMQAASDIFLGWTEDTASHRHFYVRHLKNRRLGSIGELVEEQALASYARAHARPRPCAFGRSGPTRGVYGQGGRARRRGGVVCDGLCGTHASRLRAAPQPTEPDRGRKVAGSRSGYK